MIRFIQFFAYLNLSANQIIFFMKSSPFHRNQFENTQQSSKKSKNIRYSADTFEATPSRPSLDSKKHKRKTSNLFNEKKNKDPTQTNKSRQFVCNTTKNSINITRNNSPTKGSLANSHMFIQAPVLIKHYKFYYQIGFGAFGRVWKVAEHDTGREFALKEISKSKVLDKYNNVSSVLKERQVLGQLSHPFLVNMHSAFQDDCNLYLSMDYLRGADLRYHICYKQHFSQKEIRFIAACLTLALEYIHANNVIHRDIKPQNILFEENGYVRLTDFGIAKFGTSENNPNRSQFSGTPVYMAPEILFKRDFSFQSDFYALGVVLFQLALGKRPYLGKTRSEIREELLNKEICLSQYELSTQLSPQLINLINRLLKKNPSQRLGQNGAGQLKQHPFLKGVKWNKLMAKEVKPPFIPNVVCQTQNYLNEISLFNQMNQENMQNAPQPISPAVNRQFQGYNFVRGDNRMIQRKAKGMLKKQRRGSQGKINI